MEDEVTRQELYDKLRLPNNVVDFYESFSELDFNRSNLISEMYFSHRITLIIMGLMLVFLRVRIVDVEGNYYLFVLGVIFLPFIMLMFFSYPRLTPFFSSRLDEKTYLNTLTMDFVLTLYFYQQYKKYMLENEAPKKILRDRSMLNTSNGFMRQVIWVIQTQKQFEHNSPNILYHQYLTYSFGESDIEKKKLISTEYVNKISSDNAKNIAKQLNLHYQRGDKDVALMLLRNMFEVYYEDIFIDSLSYSTPEFRKNDDYNTSLGSLMAWSEDKKDYYNGRVMRAKNELEHVKRKCESKIHSEKKYDEIITNLKEEDEFITKIENIIDALETIEVKDGH